MGEGHLPTKRSFFVANSWSRLAPREVAVIPPTVSLVPHMTFLCFLRCPRVRSLIPQQLKAIRGSLGRGRFRGSVGDITWPLQLNHLFGRLDLQMGYARYVVLRLEKRETLGVPSISILSRDPNRFRKPSQTRAKQIRFLKRTMVEKNGESPPRET